MTFEIFLNSRVYLKFIIWQILENEPEDSLVYTIIRSMSSRNNKIAAMQQSLKCFKGKII